MWPPGRAGQSDQPSGARPRSTSGQALGSSTSAASSPAANPGLLSSALWLAAQQAVAAHMKGRVWFGLEKNLRIIFLL